MNSEIGILKEEVLNCTKCGLVQSRQQVIFEEGNINGEILIIGEAPGRDEDLQGRPFVGKSGQLLDKILAACGYIRDEHVFISNTHPILQPFLYYPSSPDIIDADKKQQETENSKNNKIKANGQNPIP